MQHELELRSHSIEEHPRTRLPYGAVPLRPWQAVYPGSDENYFNASRQHIEAVAQHAMSTETLPEMNKQEIGELLMMSLLATHANRMDYNHDSFYALNSIDDPSQELQHAYDGLATPDELMDVLQEYPGIKALELAKLSHPLDFTAVHEMDQALCIMLYAYDAQPVMTPIRYKRKRVQADIPAAIVTRKTELGDIATGHGTIRVTRRQSLLVRGDTHPEDVTYERKVRNEERFDELVTCLERHFAPDSFDPGDQFVQPAATSYYAKYLDA